MIVAFWVQISQTHWTFVIKADLFWGNNWPQHYILTNVLYFSLILPLYVVNILKFELRSLFRHWLFEVLIVNINYIQGLNELFSSMNLLSIQCRTQDRVHTENNIIDIFSVGFDFLFYFCRYKIISNNCLA